MRRFVPALGIVLAFVFAWLGARAEDRPFVHAEEGSVAIGGNASNNTFISGVTPEMLAALSRPWEELTESQKKEIAKLQGDLDLNQRQVQSALEIVGEKNVPPEQLAAKLVEIAEKYKDVQTAAAAQPGDDAKITALKAEVQKAIQDGQLVKADEILAAIEKIQTEVLDRLALNAAQTTAQRGDLAMTRLRYPEGAQRFADAVAKVPQGHDDERWKYFNAEAAARYRQGNEFGDNAAALSAIEHYRDLAELRPRNVYPSDWARTQNDLGNALEMLGEREIGTERLEEAVSAYRAALGERTRDRVPLDWAMTETGLGFALFRLGERESGTARLNEAVDAYGAALFVVSRESAPRQWAAVQHDLGTALFRLGERENATARLEEAVSAYRAALEERTRARVPLAWAMTQSNLGLALAMLGARESGTTRLEEAVSTYSAVLQEFTRARVPLNWAMTQSNLGLALAMLGARDSGTARLEEAVSAYRAALEERTRDRVPLLWAKTTGYQAFALMLLAERRHDARLSKSSPMNQA